MNRGAGADHAAAVPGSGPAAAIPGEPCAPGIDEGCDAVGDADDAAAVWGGVTPLDRLIADYLGRGETCLAWRLADLAEERGFRPGVPPAILKAAVASAAVDGPYEPAAQRMIALLSGAAAALERAELAEEDGPEAAAVAENARAIFFTAMLRPALLAPDTNARSYIGGLSMRGSLAGFQPLQKVIGDLGFEFRPTTDELGRAAGRAHRLRAPAARQELSAWIESARQARSVHVPTHAILHEVLSPRGEIGEVIEAVLTGAAKAEARAGALVGSLIDSRDAQEELFLRAEQRTGRPRRDRIRDSALDWACRKLNDACQMLDDWLKAVEADRATLDDRKRQALLPQLGLIQKAMDACATDEAADKLVVGDAAASLRAAVAAFVAESVAGLGRLVAGEISPPVGLRDVFNAPLLRMPAGCQPAATGRAHQAGGEDPWREVHRRQQFAALMNPGSIAVTEAEALPLRRREAAIRPATRLLERLAAAGALGPEAIAAERQAIEEQADAARRRTGERVEALRLDLAALDSLDHGAGTEVVAWLDRLWAVTRRLVAPRPAALIGTDVDQDAIEDFPEIEFMLAEAQAFRSGIDRRIIADQRRRLQLLAAEKPEQAGHVARLVATLEARDRVTVEDQIAQLRDGQPMPEDEDAEDREEDAFAAFYPEFVQKMPETRELPLATVLQALSRGEAAGPMHFSGLDDDQRADARLLLETWRGVDHAMHASGPRNRLRDHLRRLIEALGFSSVLVTGENQLFPGRLVRCQVTTDVPRPGRWFLPPAFGSLADGSYPVFLARSDVPDDQLGAKLADARRSAPCILIVFGRLNRQRRESFARLMRRDKQTVLLIDESQVLFLATRAGDRMERLMAAAMPFGYLQPYTTDAGSIPAEMFFGRRAEIEKIESRSADGCLVYGGRQLGKSALLNHIRKRMHAPDAGVLALYRDIEMVGRADTPAERVWGVLAEALVEHGVVAPGQAEKGEVLAAVRTWLEARPERRLLMLLDETDNFLASENQRGYPNLRPLKDLMEGTGRRFKVVFAGLHNVCRTTRAPNSPLVHLGDPICVGPLNTSAANSAEARRMVTAPMQAAGYDYESPVLAWDILARVNHYPSLVQVFLKTLLESLSSQPGRLGPGPRWKLAAAQIFESSSAQEINRLIRERFQWTLDLDPRYELVAKVLAMLRLEAKEGGSADASGLLSEAIAAEVAPWWPDAIRRPSAEDFHALLDEMVGLGVLARFGPRQDRYGLRSALVAQMLGGRSDLEEQILRVASKEVPATYDGAEFHARVELGTPEPRSPLPDRTLGELFDVDRPGVRILVAAPGIWGTGLARGLATLGNDWQHARGTFVASVAKKGESAVFHRQHVRKPKWRIAVLDRGDWDDDTVRALARMEAVTGGEVLPVLIADPKHIALRVLEAGDGALPARLFFAQPWSEAMLRAWLDEVDLEPLDRAPLRRLLLAGTGGAPARLATARRDLSRIAGGSRARLEPALEDWRAAQRLRAEEVGLPETLTPMLAELVQIVDEGGLESLEAVEGLVTPVVGVDLRRALKVFAMLGLIVPIDAESVGVSPTPLARLLVGSAVETSGDRASEKAAAAE